MKVSPIPVRTTSRSRRPASLLLLLLLPLLLGSCRDPAGPGHIGDAEVRALFLGNSLTLANDLPALVRTIAEAAGHSFAYEVRANPNLSLEEHWSGGAAGAIEALQPDVVILQQGPSSLPASQSHLRHWTTTFAPVIRDGGGEPALFMVWPSVSWSHSWDDVLESYRSAAEAVDGIFIPAGESWRAVWAEDPDAPLYGPDGFHPSFLGSVVAALTIVAVLYDEDIRDLPAVIEASSAGGVRIELSPEMANLIFTAVYETVERVSSEEG